MRTTLTLDKDVKRLIQDTMHREKKSMKEIVNSGLRRGLGPQAPKTRKPFVIKARALGLQPGIDPAGFNRMVDDMEIEAYLQKTRRLEGR